MTFISDLPDVVMPGNTIALYVDDCKRSRVINCPSYQCEFQPDLDNLYAWNQKNLMDCKVKKCKLISITYKRMPLLSDIKFNNNIYILEETSANSLIYWLSH